MGTVDAVGMGEGATVCTANGGAMTVTAVDTGDAMTYVGGGCTTLDATVGIDGGRITYDVCWGGGCTAANTFGVSDESDCGTAFARLVAGRG